MKSIRLSWIASGLVGVILVTIYSLIIKLLSGRVAHGPLYFYVMSICWLVTVAVAGQHCKKPTFRELFFLLLAGLFSFLGNAAEIESISRAPQLGYVSAIKMSQVIFVTILSAIFLKKRSINILGGIGILLIILGNISISFSSHGEPNQSIEGWDALALFASGSFAVMVVLATELSKRMHVSTVFIYFLPVASLLYAFYGLGKGESFEVMPNDFGIIVLAGIAVGLSNIFQLDSIVRAPQPGYGSAMISTQVLFVTLGALIFYRSEAVSVVGAIGLGIVVLGALMISRFANR